MTLRCRPGDLAESLVAPRLNPAIKGRLVDVIHIAPAGGIFPLPDGNLHQVVGADAKWVVRFVGGGMLVPIGLRSGEVLGMKRRSYTVIPDWALRPIRPDAEPVDAERGEPVGAA